MKRNPKALNLNILETAANKVTIGFKCDPQTKLRLAHEAQNYGMTLSEYVESLVLNREQLTQPTADPEKIKQLEKRLAFYESGELLTLLDANRGKEYLLNDGTSLRVNTVHEVV